MRVHLISAIRTGYGFTGKNIARCGAIVSAVSVLQLMGCSKDEFIEPDTEKKEEYHINIIKEDSLRKYRYNIDV